jgi:RNA polymerase sigma-70 factor (ECF subfamily)
MDNSRQEPTDESLVSAACGGDDGAFARLVGRHKRRVFRLAARFARDTDELEDICQDVFIRVYEHLSAFRNDAPFEHWLTKIAVRVCHDALRGRRHEKHHTSLDDMMVELPDCAGNSESEVRQARQFLKYAMSGLSADEQLIITLLELEEFSVREASAATGWSEANVKVRAHRARQALKRVVEEHDER